MSFFKKNKSSECIVKAHDFTIVKTNIEDLHKKYIVKNWSKNREPDNVRIEQIKLQYENQQQPCVVEGIISCWQKPGENTVYVYDGSHRLTASKDFPTNIIIIKIITTDDESKIISDFRKINMSVPVPYLFLEDHNNLKIKVCESVMKMMTENWSSNVSPSRNHWKCNFNRDAFTDMILSKLDIDYTKNNIDKYIFNSILGINEQAKKYTLENNIITYKKCEKTNFYIMYLNSDTIVSKINQSSLLS